MEFIWDHFVPLHITEYTWLWLLCGIYYIPLFKGIQHMFVQWKDNTLLIKRLRLGWFAWNMMLASFSAVGSYYSIQTTKHVLLTSSDACIWNVDNSWMKNGNYGLFHFLFCFSKLVEMGDTIFLATLGKPINFLHWYHHIVTAFVCYMVMCDYGPYATVGFCINYVVHTIMYTYYGLASINIKAPLCIAKSITSVQTFQMIAIMLYTAWTGINCGWSSSVQASFMMYGLYLFLFAQYYIKRYTDRIKAA